MEIPSEHELRETYYWTVYRLAEDLGISNIHGLTRNEIVDRILEKAKDINIDESKTRADEIEELRETVVFNNVVYDPNVGTYTAHITIGERRHPMSVLLPEIELREDEFLDSVPAERDIKTGELIEQTPGDAVRWQILQDIEAITEQHSVHEPSVTV